MRAFRLNVLGPGQSWHCERDRAGVVLTCAALGAPLPQEQKEPDECVDEPVDVSDGWELSSGA